MILPTVHLNGTSREELVHQRTEARNAVRAARSALSLAAPHPRDYPYPHDCRYRVALILHQERWLLLEKLANELEAEAIAIFDQGAPL